MATPRTIARLEARILERAAHAIEFELSDPRQGFITVTRVELNNDVSTGKIFYTVLGDAGERSRVKHMLKDAAGYLQRLIGRVLNLRRLPHLTWHYDDALLYAEEMDEKIQAALKRDSDINPNAASTPLNSEPELPPSSATEPEFEDDAPSP